MANTARAVLESALRARHLDRTLTTARPPRRESPSAPFLLPSLDAALDGGLPRGQVSVVAGPRSSGRTTLLWQALAAATRRGEWVALVDAFDRADPASGQRAGVAWERLLWVRGQDAALAPVAARVADPLVRRAIAAWHLALRAGGFGVVALDLADAPPALLARVPFTTWLRAARAVEDGDVAGLVLAPRPLARSAGGLAVTLDARPRWTGAGAGRGLAGLDVRIRARSARAAGDADVALAVVGEGG